MLYISNNDFKILTKFKDFLMKVDNYLENVPRKDMYYKDMIRNCMIEFLNYIFLISYEEDINNIKRLKGIIKSKLAMLDFMLERLYIKKYISEKALYNLGNDLVEINKMTTSWIN